MSNKKVAQKYDMYFALHQRYLKNICRRLFKLNNAPETIDDRAFAEYVCFDGYTVGFKYKGDIIVAQGSLSGLDLYYRPTKFNSSNPHVINVWRTVGKDCAVCYNTANYQYEETMNPLIDYTASRLADIDISVDISAKNSRPTIIPIVKDDKEAIRVSNTLSTMYEGSPVALAYKAGGLGDKGVEIFPIKAKDNIVVAELADAKRSIMADFWQMLGVDTVAVDKKERTNLEEMNSNKTQLKLSNDIYLAPRKRWCDEMNKLFNLNMTIEFNREEVEGLYNESMGTPADDQPVTA